MKLESLTNSVILNIINSLHQELPMETLKETKYWDGDPNTEVKSLDTINLMDTIVKTFKKYKPKPVVIYLNTDDNLITIFEISNSDITTHKLYDNPNFHRIGDAIIDGDTQCCNIYLYID